MRFWLRAQFDLRGHFHANFPYFRISGQIHATASTTKIVPMPPVTVDTIAPVAAALPRTVGVVNKYATMPERNPPSSFEVPMNRLLTAETRPRFSSGVKICTSVWRTTTLMLSTYPARASIAKANQNQNVSGRLSQLPRQFLFARPKRMVATPKIATDH